METMLSHLFDYGVDEMVGGDKDHLWHHIKPHNCFKTQEQMIIVAGKGLTVTDIHGREYLDATSGGVWCVNVGYGRERIADAVAAQMKKMAYYAGSVERFHPSSFPVNCWRCCRRWARCIIPTADPRPMKKVIS